MRGALFLFNIMSGRVSWKKQKREVLDVKDGNISKLNVSRGEDLAELYAQDNMLQELDLSANKKLEILECSGKSPEIY